MADDIFSRLFELFNQPGPVNWKLAEEIAKHIAGEAAPIDPWAAEELEQLVRLSEFKLEGIAPFPVAPAASVSIVDARQWVSLALPRLNYLGERIADGFDRAPTALPHPGMSASIAGLQIGGLAGAIATSYPASFGSGLPLLPAGAILFIAQGVERVDQSEDRHQTRLWLSAHEVAHQALHTIPWLADYLAELVSAYFRTMIPDPERLLEIFESNPEALRDPAAMAEFVDRPESPAAQQLKALLGFTAGYRNHLVGKALGDLLTAQISIGSPEEPRGEFPDPGELVPAAVEFCVQVERRYGSEALNGIWDGPERLPTAPELTDPVGWAARVLLDNDLVL